ADAFARIADAGLTRLGIPTVFGGEPVTPAGRAELYEHLAAACLTAAFVLTQRDAAVSRLLKSDNEPLRSELLPRLAANELTATVGISHLTTSRRHVGRPVVTARLDGARIVLDGEVPWSTGAGWADLILTGATLEDGRELLVFVPSDAAGVTIPPPPPLLAMNGSATTTVTLDGVEIVADRIVAGPTEGVLAGGAGSVTTSALAVGAARGAIERIRDEADRRDDLVEAADRLDSERRQISADIAAVAAGDAPAVVTAASIRERSNSLAVRSAQSLMAASKGAGFVAGHPAERLVREAMFFLVWSCPQPVMAANLREFACLAD
ncbi:MAG: acyl-CoA dehydrogenase family protein, partial [Planctomycetota bacterium]